MDVNNSYYEQRYRIPSGIKGIKCLYDIAFKLQINSIKTKSGIHYHVDCTDLSQIKENKYYEEDRNKSLYHMDYLGKYSELILSELDIWRYSGTYNKRAFTNGGFSWIRLNTQFKTVEFRIGEMTFDYKVLLKRIVHINAIMRHVKNELIGDYMRENHPILKYKEEDSIENILKNRTKKI